MIQTDTISLWQTPGSAFRGALAGGADAVPSIHRTLCHLGRTGNFYIVPQSRPGLGVAAAHCHWFMSPIAEALGPASMGTSVPPRWCLCAGQRGELVSLTPLVLSSISINVGFAPVQCRSPERWLLSAQQREQN